MSQPPLTYLISDGSTKSTNFAPLLHLAAAAVQAGISYFQIREKHLTGAELFDLTSRISAITRGSETKLFVNDRLDLALAAGADGVHLTENSVSAQVIRRACGMRLMIGVSTHTLDGVRQASAEGADFAVFGPVFATASKAEYGLPVGVSSLSEAVGVAGALPLLALGGVNLENGASCLAAGAAGIAGIRLFGDTEHLIETVAKIRSRT